MAEKGAHLTGTTLVKPSIFEVIAQESLASTVEPAFKKILSFVVSFNIERYGSILRWSDEVFLIFNTVLQKYYLNKYSASFSETFYGLQRASFIDATSKGRLAKNKKRLSLLLLVLFPYFKGKLSQLSQRYKLEEADGHIPHKTWQKIFRKSIIKGHTIFFMIYESLALYNYVCYISGKSIYPTPLFKVLSSTLVYADNQSSITIDDLLSKIKNNTFSTDDFLDVFQSIITRCLELGAFFLQFMHWWNQENYHVNLMALPVPPAPKIPDVAQRYKGICPICLNPRRIHTALLVSGYVFCYQCILPSVRKNKRCPITNYPATEDDLIRLYID